jgi:DNA-directed RNA polymerase specialized sigma24 family protein
MKQAKLPKGWSLAKVQRIASYYDAQSELESVREIEDASRVAVKVPAKLLPKLRTILAAPRVEIQADEICDLHEQREQRIRSLLARVSSKSATNQSVEERRRKMKTVISRTLSRVQRLLVALHYFEEVPLSEVASLLQMTVRDVHSLHRETLERIRSAISEPRSTRRATSLRARPSHG